ncbi:SAE2-domain-containing protein [Xylariaceae sp. FL1651]|nr:SAE2-domain-containing protein [Xylariaceae sp. FL1651]
MENWFIDVGRKLLVEALGGACDRVNDEFQTDFRTYSAELETLRHEPSRVRLEEENALLKAEIKALKEASRSDAHHPNQAEHTENQPSIRTPLAPRSINQLPSSKRPTKSGLVDIENLTLSQLKAEVLRIDEKHTRLHDKYLELQETLAKSNQLLRERTTAYHQWVDHSKQLNEQSLKRSQRIRKLEAKLAEVSQNTLSLSFSSDAGNGDVAAEPATLASIQPHRGSQLKTAWPSSNARGSPSSGPCISLDRPKAVSSTKEVREVESVLTSQPPYECGRRIPLSGIEDSEREHERTASLPPLPPIREAQEESPCVKSEPSSDTPVVVSERRIKKRKHASVDEGQRPALIRVKVEHSPEPQIINERRRFTLNESIDFDTESHEVQTPKKHTKHQRTSNMYPDNNFEVREERFDYEVMQPLNNKDYDDHRHTTEESYNTNIGYQRAANRFKPQTSIGSALPFLDSQVPQPKLKTVWDIRQQLSPVILRGLTALAEDSYQDQDRLPPTEKPKKPRANVLDHLLNAIPLAEAGVGLESGNLAKDNEPLDLPRHQVPQRRELPFGKDGRKRVNLAQQRSPNVSFHQSASSTIEPNYDTGTVANSAEMRKKGLPTLRQRPKSKLQLDDFKINPNANEGYDYAFTDVVRNKDERACLQGCIKENCCGHKFRVLAHAYRAGAKAHEFQSLLESYLGDDCHRLSTMSEAEKETLWVEAKIRELANATGKHRYRYPRMSTPPGFWRADFPSTQEGEAYNEEATKLEREIIEERYREAMRPGGLWIFRDE